MTQPSLSVVAQARQLAERAIAEIEQELAGLHDRAKFAAQLAQLADVQLSPSVAALVDAALDKPPAAPVIEPKPGPEAQPPAAAVTPPKPQATGKVPRLDRTPATRNKVAKAIVADLAEHGPSLPSEVARRLYGDDMPKGNIEGIRRLLDDLADSGKVEQTGERRPPRYANGQRGSKPGPEYRVPAPEVADKGYTQDVLNQVRAEFRRREGQQCVPSTLARALRLPPRQVEKAVEALLASGSLTKHGHNVGASYTYNRPSAAGPAAKAQAAQRPSTAVNNGRLSEPVAGTGRVRVGHTGTQKLIDQARALGARIDNTRHGHIDVYVGDKRVTIASTPRDSEAAQSRQALRRAGLAV